MFSTISYLDISLVKSHLSNRWGTRRRPGCLTRIVSLPLVRFSLSILPTRLVMELGLTGNLRPLSGLSEFLYLSHIHVFCSANELSLLYSFHSTWLDHLRYASRFLMLTDQCYCCFNTNPLRAGMQVPSAHLQSRVSWNFNRMSKTESNEKQRGLVKIDQILRKLYLQSHTLSVVDLEPIFLHKLKM